MNLNLEKIHIRKEFRIIVDKEENSSDHDLSIFEENLKDGFSVRENKQNQLEIISLWSIGTMTGSFTGGGIKILAKIDEKNRMLELTSLMSRDLKFILGGVVVFMIAIPFSKEDIPIWICLLLVFIPIWFFFIYRVQEVYLMKRVVSKLRERNLIE